MESLEYKIGGIRYIQGELTWANDKRLVELYQKVQSGALQNEELKLKDIKNLLVKYNMLDRFLAIILTPKIGIKYLFSMKWIQYHFYKRISLDAATNTQLAQIFDDFFLLNRTFATKLKELGKVLGLIVTEVEKQKATTKAAQ